MLFYKRIEKEPQPRKYNFELPVELAEVSRGEGLNIS
jgi:hypothetical protein